MLLDNENENPKVYEWIEENTNNGTFDIVTGYFTIGALCFLADKTNEKISNYRFVIGDIVSTSEQTVKTIDLLNENITAKNAFKLKQWAMTACNFLKQEKVTCKTLEPNFCHAKLYLTTNEKNNPTKSLYIMGSSNLTEAGIGLKQKKNIELNTAGTGTEDIYKELKVWFQGLWEKPQASLAKTIINDVGKEVKVDFKEYLIQEISKIFQEYLPLDIYKKILFELFNLEEDSGFQRKFGKLENTIVYNKLYNFQQIGVMSIIKMLNKFDGAILADAVGLGKTWTALAVIKYYELDGRDTFLICPKKLGHNWSQYLKRTNSIFDEDQFDYVINYHTDFTETNLTREDRLKLDYLLNDKPKLIVIDESHNLRNAASKKYRILMDEILKKTRGDIKVLLLSATPINNDFRDVRNQFALMVKGRNDGFEELLDVRNLESTFRAVQGSFNKWNLRQGEDLSQFYNNVSDSDFFKLVENLVVARTRKNIKQHFDADIHFPKVEKPKNIFASTLKIGDFDDLSDLMEKLKLMLPAYQPSQFTISNDDIRARAEARAEKRKQKDEVLHDDVQREFFLVKMIKILLLKRLESSWYSFQETLMNIYNHHENVLNKINNFIELKEDKNIDSIEADFADDEDIIDLLEEISIGKKNPIKLSTINAAGRLNDYKAAIKKDKENLRVIKDNLEDFQKAFDQDHKKDVKLVELFKIINEKQGKKNKKVIIFTAYADTAKYVYEQTKKHITTKIGLVFGDNAYLGSDDSKQEIQSLLQRFAPYTKLFLEKNWREFHGEKNIDSFDAWKNYINDNEKMYSSILKGEIDILVTTDVLSEGQNLQDADLLINYDIHWNPVRVVQRFGRIDRIGSPNENIQCINFWPATSIDNYINLKSRVEKRMAVMQFIGSEVIENFTDEFNDKAQNPLRDKQNELMLKQLENKLEDLDGGNSLGFDDFSFDIYKQQLLQFTADNNVIAQYPNGIFSGAKVLADSTHQKGMIALMGRKPKVMSKYQYYYLVYIDEDGNLISDNQKTVLSILDHYRNSERQVSKAIDSGDAVALATLSDHLQKYIAQFHSLDEVQEDGTIKQTMGQAGLDAINKLKKGSKSVIEKIKHEDPIQAKYNKENFDLMAWMILS